MKNFISLAGVAAIAAGAALLPAAPVLAADVGVSLQFSQPGVYGRVDVGRYPQPEVVVQQPVLIERPGWRRAPEPVYLWVPPAHRADWRHHCGEYRACGVPVYFVRDQWYGDHVRPRGWDHRDERRRDRRDARPDGRWDERRHHD